MENVEDTLKRLSARVKQVTDEKNQKLGRLETLRAQRDELLAQLTAEGLTPQTLANAIADLDAKIAQGLADIERQLTPPNTATLS